MAAKQIAKTGTVEKVEFTLGGAGNQWTTIDGVRYATYWNGLEHGVRPGVQVEFTESMRGLWSNQPPIPHAQIIRVLPDKEAA